MIDYAGSFRFAFPPEVVWDAIEHTEQFERRWGWLDEFRLDGDGLRAGSVLTGVVSPPLPYAMRVRVELEDCVRPSSIEAGVDGDLVGRASITLSPAPGSTTAAAATIVAVRWSVEMMQFPMPVASRFGHRLLRWGHDRVVDATVAGFRRQLEDQQ